MRSLRNNPAEENPKREQDANGTFKLNRILRVLEILMTHSDYRVLSDFKDINEIILLKTILSVREIQTRHPDNTEF